MKSIVEDEDVANVVAKQTGIPLSRLTEGETQKVLKMEEILQESIIGQDDALKTVCRAIRRSRADIKDPNRPIGAFLFLGPTGVGKTLLGTAAGHQYVWRRRCPDPSRHVRIHGEICRQPDDRISSRICRP